MRCLRHGDEEPKKIALSPQLVEQFNLTEELIEIIISETIDSLEKTSDLYQIKLPVSSVNSEQS